VLGRFIRYGVVFNREKIRSSLEHFPVSAILSVPLWQNSVKNSVQNRKHRDDSELLILLEEQNRRTGGSDSMTAFDPSEQSVPVRKRENM
jgi:hypothetical protein